MNQPLRKIEVDEATAQILKRRAAEIGTSVAAAVSELTPARIERTTLERQLTGAAHQL
jgi:hypothetical protein